MKFFALLLITLAVANSFPLENEENTAPETEILEPRVQDTGDLRIQPNIPMIETPLNDPAQQSDWDGNVDWSPRGVNVGGRNENGKRGWGVSGNIGNSGGKPSWNVGVDYQHRFKKRGWAKNVDGDGLNAETPLNDPAQQSDWDGNVDWSPRGVNVGGRNENGKRGWGISGNIGNSGGKPSWNVGVDYQHRFKKRGWAKNVDGDGLNAETPLNDPAQQSDWDGNVDWSPRGVNVGGRNENGKRGWGISGNIGNSGGKPSWNVGVDYQHRFKKRGWAKNVDGDGLNAGPPYPYQYKN